MVLINQYNNKVLFIRVYLKSDILEFLMNVHLKFSDSYGVIHVYVKLWWGFTNPSNVISFVQLWPHSNRWTHCNVIGGK